MGKMAGNLSPKEKRLTIYPGVPLEMVDLMVSHYITHYWDKVRKQYDKRYEAKTGDNGVLYKWGKYSAIIYPTQTSWVLKPAETKFIGAVNLRIQS